MKRILQQLKNILKKAEPGKCAAAFFGAVLQAFGIYNIHSLSGVTEGGVLGAVLLLKQLFKISPSVSGFILNTALLLLGIGVLGKSFVFYSALAIVGFSSGCLLFEQFPPLAPQIAFHPFLAAVLGGLIVGAGAGICVRAGGATTGDDALAMSVARLTKGKLPVEWVYMLSDAVVLLLSLSYIPLKRIAWSLLTVTISGQIIGLIQRSFKKGESE